MVVQDGDASGGEGVIDTSSDAATGKGGKSLFAQTLCQKSTRAVATGPVTGRQHSSQLS